MSSIPKEHDYIGLSEAPSMEKISDKLYSSSSTLSKEENNSSNSSNTSLNLKETELRLGLPGFQSPERKLTLPAAGVSLFGKDIDTTNTNGYPLRQLKNLVSGVKRGFSDAIVGSSGKWVLSGSNGSEVDSGKGAILFSPRGDNGNSQISCVAGPAKKDDVAQSPKQVQEKNSQVAAANENSSSPAAK